MGLDKRISKPDKQDLPTPPADQPVNVTIDRSAWHEGANRAKQGGSTFDNPYPLGSAEAYSWLLGFISGGNDASSI